MKRWVTEFKAIRRTDNELVKYCGPNVPGLTHNMAQAYCDEHTPWLVVIGELVAEIPCKEGNYEPDFNNMIDYENQQNN